MTGGRCVTYVNPGILSVALYPCSIRYSPPVRARRPVPARPREGVRPAEEERARRLAGGEGGRGKAAADDGKGDGGRHQILKVRIRPGRLPESPSWHASAPLPPARGAQRRRRRDDPGPAPVCPAARDGPAVAVLAALSA